MPLIEAIAVTSLFQKFIVALGHLAPEALDGICGAPDEQIVALARVLNRSLPAEYCEFLRLFGGSLGSLQILDGYDFTIEVGLAFLEEFAGIAGENYVALPIAAGSEYDDEHVFLSLVGSGGGRLVYCADSPVAKPLPDWILARSFVEWVILSLAKSALSTGKPVVRRLSPESTWKYMAFSRVVDIDAVVRDAMIACGFVHALERTQIPVFVAGRGTFAVYERRPYRRGFVLTVGAHGPDVHHRLQRLLGARLGCTIEEDLAFA